MSATIHTAFRIKPKDHAQMLQIAQERGISMRQLVVDSALKRLPEQQNELEKRVNHLEQAVQHLERLAALS